jgi:hypothetical protein
MDDFSYVFREFLVTTRTSVQVTEDVMFIFGEIWGSQSSDHSRRFEKGALI